MDLKQGQELLDKLRRWGAVASVLLIATIVILILDKVTGCSVEKETVVETVPQTCEGLAIGSERTEVCPDGQQGERKLICTSGGTFKLYLDSCRTPEPSDDAGDDDGGEGGGEGGNAGNGGNGGNNGGGGDCVEFAKAKPIITDYCLRCHAGLDTYETARAWAPKIKARTGLLPEDRLHMPPASEPQPQPAQLLELTAWVDGGTKDTCGAEPPPRVFLDLDYVEAVLFRDLTRDDGPDANDRETLRYLVTAHKYDEGAAQDTLTTYIKAMQKTLNSVSVREKHILKAVPVDELKSIWRFDLEDFGLDGVKWNAVENADQLKIVSETDLGRAIRDLVNADLPWLHVDNFIDITQRNADVYYTLTDTPATLAEYQRQQGVRFDDDVGDLDALFIGSNRSPISLLKNRILIRLESAEGYYWQTLDPVDLNGDRTRNAFETPLIKETGSRLDFNEEASETITSLKNGMQHYALWNKAGQRQNAAPLNVVADNRSPITPEIKNAISCHRCHASGILPMKDQIRDHVLLNAAQFDILDVERVKQLYCAVAPDVQVIAAHAKRNQVMTQDVRAQVNLSRGNSTSAECARNLELQFAADQAAFAVALKELDIKPTDEDPINLVSDRFLLDWDATRVASFLFLTADGFAQCINQSATAKAQIGQLLTPGGTITYNQFVEVLPTLVRDCRLFQEPI